MSPPRSLHLVLEYLLYSHDHQRCTCDMRTTMALACASPWSREQTLRCGAYSLGQAAFELEELTEEAEQLAEVGLDVLCERQQAYAAALTDTPTRAWVVSPHVKRLHVRFLRDEDARDVSAGSPVEGHGIASVSSPTATGSSEDVSLAATVAWWRPHGWTVWLEGRRCSLPEMEAALHTAQHAWGCRVTGLCVEGYSRPNPAEEKAAVARLLQATAASLRYLEVECLELPASAIPGMKEVRRVVLNHCASSVPEVATWLCQSPLEAIFLSYDSPFKPLDQSRRENTRDADGRLVTELTPLTPPSVRHLMLDQTNVTPEHLTSIRCREGLQRLSLIDCDQMDEVDLTGMTRLRALLLSRCPIASTDALANLSHCSQLVLLNLCGCTELEDINAVGELHNLRELFAYQIGVGNDGIHGLAQCEALEKINLGGCLRISDVTPLGNLKRLKDLALWGTRITNKGIAALSGCDALDELVLDDCTRITDVSALAPLQNLRWLSLIGTNVTIAGVAALAQCPKLEVLAIAGTEIERAPRLWNHSMVLEFLERVSVEGGE